MLTQVDVHVLRQSTLELPIVGAEAWVNAIQVRNITGLEPVSAAVNTTPYGSVDGESYAGSSVGKRNIVLTLGLNPNWANQTMSSLRHMLYKYFMPKQKVRLRFFSDTQDPCEIIGYVESCDPNIFSKDPEMLVSIICPLPDFVGISSITVEGVVNTNGVPVAIDYAGSVPVGFYLNIVNSPGTPDFNGQFWARNVASELIQLGFSGWVHGDRDIRLSTVSGEKYIHNYVFSQQRNDSILGTITQGSKWPVLEPGTNDFSVISIAGGAGQTWELTYVPKYGGL